MSVTSLKYSNPSTLPQRLQKQTASLTGQSSANPSEAMIEESGLLTTQENLHASNQGQNEIGIVTKQQTRDEDDKIIAAWFKLMKPHAYKNAHLTEKRAIEDDPGRVPDPLYEPTKENVPNSLKIITFNDLMRALAPKKPHWKHYDDVNSQFQVCGACIVRHCCYTPLSG